MMKSILIALLLLPLQSALSLEMEQLPGEGVWVSPPPYGQQLDRERPFRVTVWFEPQFLADGKGYQRRAKEFSKTGRRTMRAEVIKALKAANTASIRKATPALKKLAEEQIIGKVEPHWIVNGFSVSMMGSDIDRLKEVPGVREIFICPDRSRPRYNTPPEQADPSPKEPDFESLSTKGTPWYVNKLGADRVWQELGITGKGTLNVIHDNNFIFSPHLNRTVYRNPNEIPNNGKDDDGNGYVDDFHGYNFDLKSPVLHTVSFLGDLKNRRLLHGTNCANIVSGSGDGEKRPAYGLAPRSRWAGVINLGGIERSVEWAIEQGADTYSMSFSRMRYGEYRSHWRKVMEHGNFCGLFFVSGAGNRRDHLKNPFLMNIPQDIPNAVFAAAGVQRDLSKTEFSCVGPVEWKLRHYQDGIVQKPEVCAFNQGVPCQLPDGKEQPKLLNGNSYAGPMFCGAISLMLSADPDLLPWNLQDIITSTAKDVGPKGVDNETGHGLIDCYAAVKEVLRRKDTRPQSD